MFFAIVVDLLKTLSCFQQVNNTPNPNKKRKLLGFQHRRMTIAVKGINDRSFSRPSSKKCKSAGEGVSIPPALSSDFVSNKFAGKA